MFAGFILAYGLFSWMFPQHAVLGNQASAQAPISRAELQQFGLNSIPAHYAVSAHWDGPHMHFAYFEPVPRLSRPSILSLVNIAHGENDPFAGVDRQNTLDFGPLTCTKVDEAQLRVGKKHVPLYDLVCHVPRPANELNAGSSAKLAVFRQHGSTTYLFAVSFPYYDEQHHLIHNLTAFDDETIDGVIQEISRHHHLL